MGAGIAIVAARAGFTTICYDIAAGRRWTRARKQTDGFFAKSVERGKMTPPTSDARHGAAVAARRRSTTSPAATS